MKRFMQMFILLLFFGVSYGEVRLSPPSYDFGLVTIDTTISYPFELKNLGSSHIHVCGINLSTGTSLPVYNVEEDNCTGRTLLPSETCTVNVSFKPLDKSLFTASLTFIYDDDGDEIKCNTKKIGNVKIKGGGTSLRIMRIYPEPVIQGFNFEFPQTPYGERKKMIFRICNAGGENIVFSSPAIVLENLNTTAFGISFSSCDNATLVYHPNNESCSYNYCEFEVVFDPSADTDISRNIVHALIHINDINAGPGNVQSNLRLYVVGRTEIPEGEIIYAPVGGKSSRSFTLDFTCPDNGNNTPGETINIGNTIYSVIGPYFFVDEASSYCPNTCIENSRVNCTITVVFKPEAPGIYEGKIVISSPTGYFVENTIIGMSGSFTGNYLLINPQSINFVNTLRLHIYEQVLEIRNSTDGLIPMDIYALGEGFGINRINCGCNDGYYYDGRFCIPNQDSDLPTVGRPYRIKPGEICTVNIYFFQPIAFSTDKYYGEIVVSTPVKAHSIPLQATSSTFSIPPTSEPSPSLDFGGSGGGCNSAGSSLGIYVLLIALYLFWRNYIK